MTTPINRRNAFAAIAAAAGAVLAAPAAALVSAADELPAVIAAHRKAREAFMLAIVEQEAAAPDPDARVAGIGNTDYSLRNGKERIAKWIGDHFEHNAKALRFVDALSPGATALALEVLERERAAALARLDEAFAPSEAAHRRWRETCDAEEATLEIVCAHRCGSTAEVSTKFRYLLKYRSELSVEQRDAIFASLLPEGEAVEGPDDGA